MAISIALIVILGLIKEGWVMIVCTNQMKER